MFFSDPRMHRTCCNATALSYALNSCLSFSQQSTEYQAGSPTIDQTMPNVIPEIDANRLVG